MMDALSLVKSWWDRFQPYVVSKFNSIESTLPPKLNTSETIKFPGGEEQPIASRNLVDSSCQYWVRGLSPVCSNWDGDKCVYDSTDEIPSGYNNGSCDGLGRRNYCDKYEASSEFNPDEYVCILPCLEKSGFGKQTEEFGTVSLRPFTKEEIKGYNTDELGVGRCDGLGLGRGSAGYGSETIEELYKLRPICKHYRPQNMGFGLIEPRPFHGSEHPGKPFDSKVNWIPETTEELHDGSQADPLSTMHTRLPFAFQVYNSRACYQKCAYWQGDPGIFMVDDYQPDWPFIRMDGPSGCSCEDSICDEYKDVVEDWPEDVPSCLVEVWASYGGIVCNGAKPECPYYTGKWHYCIDTKMQDGMKITADQVFELRFWASNWVSQEEYDSYYLSKPGPNNLSNTEESTSDIYTFSKWRRLDSIDPDDSIMIGYRHTMCMPALLHDKEFDPDVYITKTQVEYPKINQFTGSEPINTVSFPTLVRELDNPLDFLKDIELIFPYFVEDPWDLQPCDEVDGVYIHNTNYQESPSITAIGFCSENCDVYVINKTLIKEKLGNVFNSGSQDALKFMNSYVRAQQIPFNNRSVFNEKMDVFIDEAMRFSNGFVAYTSSTANEEGGFRCEPVDLLLETINELYIICNYDGNYVYKKIRVKSLYWGALIKQTSFSFEPPGDAGVFDNYFPYIFLPSCEMGGQVETTYGSVSKVFSVHSKYEYGLQSDTTYYSYCINKYTEEEVVENQWCRVGNTSYIWVEIDNSLISYLWDFNFISGTLVNNESPEESVNLTLVYPGDESQRRTIPPSALLLKADEKGAFFNSDYTLKISYSYNQLETFVGEDPVWPDFSSSFLAPCKFQESPYLVEHEPLDETFVVKLAYNASIKLMTFITDNNGRVQAAAATKFLYQGQKVNCRNVDIRYAYTSDAKEYHLQPQTGFRTHREEALYAGMTKHSSRPACGDHDCTPGRCIGPMWFPFDNCVPVMYYNIHTPAANCTLPMSEGFNAVKDIGYGAWRYLLPEIYIPWCVEGGNWASACGTNFGYRYSESTSNIIFSGRARKRTKVDLALYSEMQWRPPPFGNLGRECVERYITRDYCSHYDSSGSKLKVTEDFMPMVFDKEDLVTDLNCFSSSSDSLLGEPFCYLSTMSLLLANFINESIETYDEEEFSNDSDYGGTSLKKRYRFDEIIDVVFHGNCMYPPPVWPTAGSYKVCRYKFKNENHFWAWPEFWYNIERGVSEEKEKSNVLFFLKIERPDYYFDTYKYEHRLITDEGLHTIVFEPPSYGEKAQDGNEGSADRYPSISLDGGYPRYFKLVYDNYGDGLITWMDEGSSGEVGGSDGNNIYEKTMTTTSGINWIHDRNTIFDSEASSDPEEDRKATVIDPAYVFNEEDAYGYYNRGLISKIYKNKLKYLPMEEYQGGSPTKIPEAKLKGSTDDISEMRFHWEGFDPGEVPIKVNISGYYGKVELEGEDLYYSIPGVYIAESTEDNEDLDFPSDNILYSSDYVSGSSLGFLEEFNLEINLSKFPDRMTQRLSYFQVKLDYVYNYHISNVSVTIGKYVRREEKIMVFERKYNVGEGSIGSSSGEEASGNDTTCYNADGPSSRDYRDYDRDFTFGGQYFPFSVDETFSDSGGNVLSKLNMVGMSTLYKDDEDIPVTFETLKKVELEVQRDLYNEAMEQDDYDSLVFSGVIPPGINGFLVENGLTRFSPIKSLNLFYPKIVWKEDNSELKQTDYIYPGGHYFDWSAGTFKTRCTIFGVVRNVFTVGFYHIFHGPEGPSSTWGAHEAYVGWSNLEYMNNLPALNDIDDSPVIDGSLAGGKRRV